MTTAGAPQRDHWEARHSLLYGSRLIKTFPSEQEAELFARAEIQGAGGEGRIVYVCRERKTLIYNTYPDDDY